MIRIDIKGVKEVQDKLARLRSELHQKVLQPAMNKVAEKALAEINRAIPEEYAVKASEVRNAVSLRRAQAGRIEAVLEIFGSARKKGRSLNLIHFLAAVQQAGRTVAVKGKRSTKADRAALDRQLGFIIKRGGGLKKIEGAFVGNKGRTIFRRTPGKKMGSRSGPLNKHTEAIEPVQVIGFSQMFASKKISQRVIDRINSEFPVEIDRAVQMLLARAGL